MIFKCIKTFIFLLGLILMNHQYYSLFTQPGPQGLPSRFSLHSKGACLPHPIIAWPGLLWRGQQVKDRKSNSMPRQHPSTSPSGPGLKSAARVVESKLPYQLHIPQTLLLARPEVYCVRRRKQTHSPAARSPSAPQAIRAIVT